MHLVTKGGELHFLHLSTAFTRLFLVFCVLRFLWIHRGPFDIADILYTHSTMEVRPCLFIYCVVYFLSWRLHRILRWAGTILPMFFRESWSGPIHVIPLISRTFHRAWLWLTRPRILYSNCISLHSRPRTNPPSWASGPRNLGTFITPTILLAWPATRMRGTRCRSPAFPTPLPCPTWMSRLSLIPTAASLGPIIERPLRVVVSIWEVYILETLVMEVQAVPRTRLGHPLMVWTPCRVPRSARRNMDSVILPLCLISLTSALVRYSLETLTIPGRRWRAQSSVTTLPAHGLESARQIKGNLSTCLQALWEHPFWPVQETRGTP